LPPASAFEQGETPAMTWTTFDLDIFDNIATIRLNRPDELNSFVPALWRELPEAVAAIDRQASARVIVIASTGRHFTAGMDLTALTGLVPGGGGGDARERAQIMRLVADLQETFNVLERARMPVIAAVQGGCIGAGLDMVTACDLRHATADAFFCLQEINLALTADVGTFPRILRHMPDGVARELAFTGARLDAARAERIGLVNAVHADVEAMMAAVTATARTIAAKSPLAVWGSKEMLNYARDHTGADTLRHVAVWQAGMLHAGEIARAVEAQEQQRPASFADLLADRKL
jgi:enoyl-CoA hydratase